MRTTSQKHAALKKLSKQTQDNIFEMLTLANEILHDAEYVDQFGGEADVIDAMELSEFSHFGGQPSLPSMLRAFRANPKKSTWQEYNFNLRVMIDLAEPERERGDVTRVNWKAKCATLEEELAEVREECSQLRGQVRLLTERQDEPVAA